MRVLILFFLFTYLTSTQLQGEYKPQESYVSFSFDLLPKSDSSMIKPKFFFDIYLPDFEDLGYREPDFENGEDLEYKVSIETVEESTFILFGKEWKKNGKSGFDTAAEASISFSLDERIGEDTLPVY